MKRFNNKRIIDTFLFYIRFELTCIAFFLCFFNFIENVSVAMAKTARRLVASDVSSPILGYSEHHSHRSTARTYRSSADTNQPTQDVKQNSTTHHTSRKTRYIHLN